MAYDKDRNYQEEIKQAVASGDYASASRLEKERNEKIVGENLSYSQTNQYSIPNGVSDENYNKMMSEYKQSDDVLQKGTDRENAAGRLNDVTNKDNIVSEGIYSTLNRQFETPLAVQEADRYLSDMLQKIQSGKTSYSDKLSEMMDTIMNREKFSYDVDTDPLFQQALASAMNSGKQAMQDTIGQASALTGGYGSTYATTAGNQVYNDFIEDAYDNLPQYYQMALEAYQLEGDELYRQYGMLYDADATEFSRNVTAYDATYQNRNRMYDEAYANFRDGKTDALNIANLQISEHNQIVNDAYTAYNVLANEEETAYERDYQSWIDGVNQAWQMAQMENTDWWNQSNQDFTASESQKDRDHQTQLTSMQLAHDSSENQKNREHDITMANMGFEHDINMANLNASLRGSSGGGGGSGGGSGSGGGGKPSTLTDTQISNLVDTYIKAGGGEAGYAAVDGRLEAIGKNNLSEDAMNYLSGVLNDTFVPSYYQDWNITDDGDTFNWFGGNDDNDVYSNGSTTMTYKELRKAVEGSDLSEEEKKKFLGNLKGQSKK